MNLWKGISWYEGIQIGWLLQWRGFLMGILVGAVIGIIGGLFGIPSTIIQIASVVAALALVWPVVLSQMFRKNFKGFHIIIVREPASLSIPNPST